MKLRNSVPSRIVVSRPCDPHSQSGKISTECSRQVRAIGILVLVATCLFRVSAASGADVVWFDDVLPSGAVPNANGGDSWNWVKKDPNPFSGTQAHRSNLAAGLHEHFFNWAGSKLRVDSGDTLFAY